LRPESAGARWLSLWMIFRAAIFAISMRRSKIPYFVNCDTTFGVSALMTPNVKRFCGKQLESC
jgi:hypothetical protein